MDTMFSTHVNLVLSFLCETLSLSGEANGPSDFSFKHIKRHRSTKKCQSKEWCHQPSDELPIQKPVNVTNLANVNFQSQQVDLENHNLQ